MRTWTTSPASITCCAWCSGARRGSCCSAGPASSRRSSTSCARTPGTSCIATRSSCVLDVREIGRRRPRPARPLLEPDAGSSASRARRSRCRRRAARRDGVPRARPLRRPRHPVPRVRDRGEGALKVAKDRLAALGLATGAWLRELKHGGADRRARRDADRRAMARPARASTRATRPLRELRHLVARRRSRAGASATSPTCATPSRTCDDARPRCSAASTCCSSRACSSTRTASTRRARTT